MNIKYIFKRAGGHRGERAIIATDERVGALCEVLESRTMLAAEWGSGTELLHRATAGVVGGVVADVRWDGGGDGTRWQDERNWTGDRLPTARDGVEIGATGKIIIDGGAAAAWLSSAAGLAIVAGELRVVGDARVGGGLDVAGDGYIIAGGLFTSDGAWQSILGTVQAADIYLDGGRAGRVWMEGATIRVVSDGGGPGLIKDGYLGAAGLEQGFAAGRIIVLGGHIGVSSSELQSPGGRILLGGGFRGGEGLPASEDVRVDRASRLSVSTEQSNGLGGDVVVWSNSVTRFWGTIDARGGAGGQGGKVEVSSKDVLDYDGTIDVTASGGQPGEVLFDPRTLTIASSGVLTASGNQFFNDNANSDVTMSVQALTNVLNTGANLVLEANRDILVTTSIIVDNPSGNGGRLILRAGRSVDFSAGSYRSDGGDLEIYANHPDPSPARRGTGAGIIDLHRVTMDMAGGDITLSVMTNGSISNRGRIELPGAVLDGGLLTASGATVVLFSSTQSSSYASLNILPSNGAIELRGRTDVVGQMTFSSPTIITGSSTSVSALIVIFQNTINGQSFTLSAAVDNEVVFNAAVTNISTLTVTNAGRSSPVAPLTVGGAKDWTGIGITTESLSRLGAGVGTLIVGGTGTNTATLRTLTLSTGITLRVETSVSGLLTHHIFASGTITAPGGIRLVGNVMATANVSFISQSGGGLVIGPVGGTGTLTGVGLSIFVRADSYVALATVGLLSIIPATVGRSVVLGPSSGTGSMLLSNTYFGTGTGGELALGNEANIPSISFVGFSAPGWRVSSSEIGPKLVSGRNTMQSLQLAGGVEITDGGVLTSISTALGQTYYNALKVPPIGAALADEFGAFVFGQAPFSDAAGSYLQLGPTVASHVTFNPPRGLAAAFNLSPTLISSLAGTNVLVRVVSVGPASNVSVWDAVGAGDVFNFSAEFIAAGTGIVRISKIDSTFVVAGTLTLGASASSIVEVNNSIISGDTLTFRGPAHVVPTPLIQTVFRLSSNRDQRASADVIFANIPGSVLRSPTQGGTGEVNSLTVETSGSVRFMSMAAVSGIRNVTIDGHLAGGTIRASGDVGLSRGGSGSIVVEVPAGVLTFAGAINGTSLVFEASDFEVGGTIGFSTLLRWKSTRAMVVGGSVPEAGVANLTQDELARVTPANAGSVTSVENVRRIQSVASAGTLRVKGELVGAERRVTFVGVVSAAGRIELDSGAVMLAMGSLLTAPQILGLGNLPPVIGSPGGRIVANGVEWLLYRDAVLTIMPIDADRSVAIGDPLRGNELQLSHASFLENTNIQIGDGTRRLDIYLVGDGGESPITGSELASLTLRPGTGGVIRAVGLFVFGGSLVLDGPVLVEPLVLGEIPLLAAALIAFNGETNIAGNGLNIATRVLQVSGAFVGGGSIRVQDGPDVYEGSITINSTPAAGSLHLSRQMLLALAAGGASVTIGTAAAQAYQTIALYGGAEAFVTPLSLEVGGMNGRVTIRGDAVRLAATAPLSILGPGRTIFIETDILTQGAPVTFNDGVRIASPLVVIATDDGGALLGAPVNFNGELNSEENEFNSLVVRGGGLGSITLGGEVGIAAADYLQNITLNTRAVIYVATPAVRTQSSQRYEGYTTLLRTSESFAAGGELLFAAQIEMGVHNYTLRAGEINLGGELSGTGLLSFETDTPERDMELAGEEDPLELDLTNAELDFIQPGFENVTFGRRDGSGTLHVGADVMFVNNTLLTMGAAGGRIRSPYTIRGTPGIRVIVTGPGQTFETGGGIIIEGGEIIINDGVRLIGNARFDTTGEGASAVGGSILITGAVNSGAGLMRTLEVNSGERSVIFQGAVGTLPGGLLGEFVVSAGGGLLLSGGAVSTFGEQTYNAPTAFANGAVFSSVGSNVTFNGTVAGVPSIQVAAGTGVVTFNQPVDRIEMFTAQAGQVFVFNSTSSFGTLTISGGNVMLNGASAIGSLVMNAGVLRGQGLLSITGTGSVFWGGVVEVGGAIGVGLGAVLSLEDAVLTLPRAVYVTGTLILRGTDLQFSSGLLRVLPGGRVNLTGIDPFIRGGRIELLGGLISSAPTVEARFAQVEIGHSSGTLQASMGRTTVEPLGGVYNVGGRLSVVGAARLHVAGSVMFAMQSTFAPVFVASGGVLQMPLLTVSGRATLAGTIEIGLIGRWLEAVPSVTVLSASERVGRFHRMTVSPKYTGLHPLLRYSDGEVQLSLLPVFYAIAGGPG